MDIRENADVLRFNQDFKKEYSEFTALIQRIPEVLDPNDDVVAPSNTGFGRKFVIASLRWAAE